MHYKFIATNAKPRADILNNPQEFLKSCLSSPFNFGVDNITRLGTYKEMGIAYDLRPFLKRYVFKSYGSWCESYAINKTNLRKIQPGKIDKIIEITY